MVNEKRVRIDLATLWEGRNQSKHIIAEKLKCCIVHSNHNKALENSFAAAILTEWEEFINYDWNDLSKNMIQPAKIFDGRNILKKDGKIDQYFIGK